MKNILSDILSEQIKNLGIILDEIGEQVEGNLICDVHSSNLVYDKNFAKIHNLQSLVRDKNKVCEIGVNAGHSLLIMLEQNPNAEYYLFDLGYHKYTQPCIEYIRNIYSNTKINIIYGDSKKTLQKFIVSNPNILKTFDFIHIDGGHGELEFTNDFYYTKLLSSDVCINIFDDYNYPKIKEFLDLRLNNNTIKQYQSSNVITNERQLIYTNV